MIFKTLLFFIFIDLVVTGNELDKEITIDSLSILKSSSVHMKNESAVFEKINKIVSQGADKLQFITDFDKTVTKQHDNNNTEALHSFKIFYRCKQLPKSNLNVINAVLEKYDEIEFDPTVGAERKKRIANYMYQTIHEQLKGIEFDRGELEEVARKYGPSIRDKTNDLFSRLKHLHVPGVLFSAGLADVIEEQLKLGNIQYDAMHIMADHLDFNGTTLVGLKNPEKLINPFNKHEHLSQYLKNEALKNRKNIIIMGDNIGDAAMISGFESQGTVLKIGYFYNQTEDSLKSYKEAFDVVLIDDQTMNVILDILKFF